MRQQFGHLLLDTAQQKLILINRAQQPIQYAGGEAAPANRQLMGDPLLQLALIVHPLHRFGYGGITRFLPKALDLFFGSMQSSLAQRVSSLSRLR
ncbi:hypothetical protein BLA50215_07911 [Burkholderia lata]|nr:hypothetical protein BLA50215_07911 [Burkholderia lata]